MKYVRYTGILAVLMVLMVLGAIPAVATGEKAPDEGRKNVDDITETMPVRVVRGRFAGVLLNDEGEVHGRVLGIYVLYMTEDDSSVGRFRGKWTCGDMIGRFHGVMRDGEFKGRWREMIRYRLMEQYKLERSGTDFDAVRSEVARPHYGMTTGSYALLDDGIHLRGTWTDLLTGESGYVKAYEYDPEVTKGKFRGAWVKVDAETDAEDVSGTLYGCYVKNPLRPGGKFAGRWAIDGEDKGSLRGVYRGGNFKGVWTNPEGKIGGYLKGTYGDGVFQGRWFNRDGTLGGYLKGEYGRSPVKVPEVATNERSVAEAEA